jgi:hypothetical protein
LLKSTADSFLLPEPIKIAINSASLKTLFALEHQFSRGLSSSDQLVIGKRNFQPFILLFKFGFRMQILFSKPT